MLKPETETTVILWPRSEVTFILLVVFMCCMLTILYIGKNIDIGHGYG